MIIKLHGLAESEEAVGLGTSVVSVLKESKCNTNASRDAYNTLRPGLGLRNRRQQKRSQDSDDGDDHQEFNQRKRRLIVPFQFNKWQFIVLAKNWRCRPRKPP